MRTHFAFAITLSAFVLALGCEPDANIATEDSGARDAATSVDAGASDAGDCTPVECAAPPEGCHYEGFDICTTCGTLVCDAVVCGGGEPRFPTFAEDCMVAADCVAAQHQVDCCGTYVVLGIRADQQMDFAAAEAMCRDMYGACGCAPRATEADDGTVDDGSRAARVECVAGTCTSTFGLPSGATCGAGAAVCGAGLSCCYPCGIPGCDNQCEPTCDPGTPGCVDGCVARP